MTPLRSVFTGSGEMAGRMREIDWAKTCLGPVQDWPQSLRSALGICVESGFPIAIYWGPDLTLLYNDGWMPIPGEKHPWALGRPARDVWPEIWTTIGPLFDQVLSTGTSTYLQDSLLLMHRHGYTEECYFNYTFTPIRGEGGVIEGIFNAVVETTYRVIAERRSALLGQIAHAISGLGSIEEICARAALTIAGPGLDATFALVYLFDHTTQSARLVANAGLTPATAAAPTTVSLADLHPWPMPHIVSSTEPVVLNALESTAEMHLPGGAWSEPTRTAIAVPLLTGAGQRPSGCLILGASPRRAVDDAYRQFAGQAGAHIGAALSATMAFEIERQRAERLAALDRAKTAFFSNVSHEFRTPLTLLMGPLEDALALEPPALQGADLVACHRNAQRLLKLVNGLLDVVRLEGGHVDPLFEAVDIGGLTAEYASTFRAAVERAGLQLRIERAPQVDDVYVDRELWETVVLNLLSNAFKFTFDGEIVVSVTNDAGVARVRVSDTGAGIAADHLPRIFDRFSRIEQARSRTLEGSGIGLALVKDLVELHGGRIDVESTPGQGTTFTISLKSGHAHLPPGRIVRQRPVIQASRASSFVAEAMRWVDRVEADGDIRRHDREPGGVDRRVLVADDNADLREYITRLLSPIALVSAVATGEEALEALRREPFDLVLTDVMMPNISGFELLEAIRADEHLRTTPVLMLSARAGEEARLEGLERGADDYIVKPFAARELVAKTVNHLALASARREVREERDRFRELLGRVPASVNFLAGPDLVVEYAHPVAVRAAGGRALQGKALDDALPEFRGHPFLQRLRQVYATGEPAVMTEVMLPTNLRQDGLRTETYWNSVYLPVSNAGGTIEGVMTFDLDVTEQVLARQAVERQAGELEAARREAERANRAKDEFLAILSHELRNPLSPIATAVQLLRLRGQESRELAVIDRQVKHLTRLVDDLLDVSRVTRGKVELHRRPVDLAEVMSRAVEMASPLLEERQQHLDLDMPGGLVIDVDIERLAQVLGNLLTNASKYSDRATRIRLTAERRDAHVVISVIDDGIGIPADMLNRVFDAFVQQPQSSDRSYGGLGLGLAIARSLVERHDGSIRAESDGLGTGSRFVVELPASQVAAAPEFVPDVAIRLPQRRGRVMVVDDNVDSADMLAQALTLAGYEIRVAHDGPTALDLARRFNPAVAVLDIGLPVMDGYELGARLRADPAGGNPMTLIAVTGYGQDLDRQRSSSTGFLAHLVKPIDLAMLGTLLDTAIPE